MTRDTELFEGLPDGVTVHHPADGTILRANEAFCELLGYTPAELRELSFDDLHVDEPPYTAERGRAYIQEAATAGPQTFEWVTETKAGDPLPVEVSLRQTTIDGAERVVAVVRDISERKQRERELEQANRHLEKFAGIVSHDLRNPLSVIQGRVELARETGPDGHLTAIGHAADRMDELIENLLALAKDGDAVGELEPIELDAIVERCWRNVDTNGATLHVESSAAVMADRIQLQQVLENLLRNAVEHADAPVEVSVGVLDDDGFFVADSGPGIPPGERDRVFETGYTLAEDGTGFGLAIVQQIAAGHEWDVRLAESADGGARFEFGGVEVVG